MTSVYPRIPCPFVYNNGKKCTGQIISIEAYKADISWELNDNGWGFDFRPRSHYHLFCSEKGNHAGYRRQDDPRMKCHLDQLPDGVRQLIEETKPSECGRGSK